VWEFWGGNCGTVGWVWRDDEEECWVVLTCGGKLRRKGKGLGKYKHGSIEGFFASFDIWEILTVEHL
jgi:hypothetical protein